MIIFESLGLALNHQKVVPANTATGFGAEMYRYYERRLDYTSGGTTTIAVGDWIVGATSAAKAQVLSVTLSSGTWGAGTAAGYFIIGSQHGTFQSENLKVAAGTDDATTAANSRLCMDDEYIRLEFKGWSSNAALISVLTNTALVAWNGAKPDQTALVGQPMVANSSVLLRNIADIENFKCIDRVASSASEVNATFYFGG